MKKSCSDKRALIAMSGGVDSSVAALLMKEKGYICEGATMRLYRSADIGINNYHTCCSQRDIDDAAEVAFDLGIDFSVVDFTNEFEKAVIEKFICTYEKGQTPNPCIDCNHYMKFDHLLTYALSNGFENIVTGHYARIEYDKERNRWLLRKAKDPGKDQSYVLYMLTQEQLSHVILPLGNFSKDEVRLIARENGLVNAHKHDSQDICFVPDGNYVRFMEKHTGKHYPTGDFLDIEGNRVGTHKGAVGYTIGQRKGLGLSMGEPVYVCRKCMQDNTVTVGPERELYVNGLYAGNVNWILFDTLEKEQRLTACTRYHQKEKPATISIAEDGRLKVIFDEPVRAVSSGQSVVLYKGEYVVGGGIIEETF